MKADKRLFVSLLILAFFVAIGTSVIFMYTRWPWSARLFPIVVSTSGIAFMIVAFLTDRRGATKSGARDTEKRQDSTEHRDQTESSVVAGSGELGAMSWFAGLLGAIYLFGFHVAVPSFGVLYLRKKAESVG